MKHLITLCIAILLTTSVFAQTPEKFSYQAIVRDAGGNLVKNQTVGMQISILQTTSTGAAVYVETHTPTTNVNGLVSLEIGTGNVVSGAFITIDWGADTYFIKTETDPVGGTTYTITGTSQLMSVPYALHAATAKSLSGGITETDPVFGSSVASGITGVDTNNWNNKLDVEIDGSITNELQSLSISNNTLSISNGNNVVLPGGTAKQNVFRTTTGTSSLNTINWTNMATATGTAEINGPFCYALQTDGIYVDGTGRNIYLRLEFFDGTNTIYLPSTEGHSNYIYITNNRLETWTNTYCDVSLASGTYTVTLQWRSDNSQPATWNSQFGQLNLIIW